MPTIQKIIDSFKIDTPDRIDSNINQNKKIGIGLQNSPSGIAIDSLKNKLYVANFGSNTISVLDGNTNNAVANISVGSKPDTLIL